MVKFIQLSKKLAADIAVSTVKEFVEVNPGTLDLVEWALFDDDTLQVYEDVLSGGLV